jgi:hypothetical protein
VHCNRTCHQPTLLLFFTTVFEHHNSANSPSTPIHPIQPPTSLQPIFKMSGFPKLIPAFTTHVRASLLVPPRHTGKSYYDSNAYQHFPSFNRQRLEHGTLCIVMIVKTHTDRPRPAILSWQRLQERSTYSCPIHFREQLPPF